MLRASSMTMEYSVFRRLFTGHLMQKLFDPCTMVYDGQAADC